MPQSEFRLWQAEYALSPFGEERADARAAQIAWTFASVFSSEELDIKDFKLKFKKIEKNKDDEMEEHSELEMARVIQSIFGGTIERI